MNGGWVVGGRRWRVVVVTVLVGVVASGHVFAVQASQQLGALPAQAAPFAGGLHACALFLTPQCRVPFAVVRQQVTAPARPHVEAARQCLTAALHDFGRPPDFAAAPSTPAAQCM